MEGTDNSATNDFLRDISELFADGMSREEIARELDIKPGLVSYCLDEGIIPALYRVTGLSHGYGESGPLSEADLAGLLYTVFSPDSDEETYLSFQAALDEFIVSNTSEHHSGEGYHIDFQQNYPEYMTFEPDASEAAADNPFENLDTRHITIGGLLLLRSDPAMTQATFDRLMESEEGLLKDIFGEYRFLMGEHDAMEVYLKYFSNANFCGQEHLSSIIRRNPDRSYASLIAEFSADKGIPFIVGALLIKDYIEIEGGILYTAKKPKSRYCESLFWTPASVRSPPPVNYSRMAMAGFESAVGSNDRYIVRTYLDSGCNMENAAKLLGIPRKAVSARLSACGLDSSMRTPENLRLWLDRNRDECTTSGDAFTPASGQLPPDCVQDPLELALAYYRNGKSERIAAESLGMTEEEYREAVKPVISEGRKTTELAVAAASIAGHGYANRTATLLNITEEWCRKRMGMIHASYRAAMLPC